MAFDKGKESTGNGLKALREAVPETCGGSFALTVRRGKQYSEQELRKQQRGLCKTQSPVNRANLTLPLGREVTDMDQGINKQITN